MFDMLSKWFIELEVYMIDVIQLLWEWSSSESFILIFTVFSFVITIFLYNYKMLKLNKRSNLEELQIKRDVIEDISKEDKENNQEFVKKIFNYNISYENIDSNIDVEDKFIYKFLNLHHKQALQQSNIQFWFSIIVSIIGFSFIILIVLLSENNEWYDYIFKIIPGTIIETISVLFISQARETRDKATRFFTELNYQKQIEKSIEVADSIEDAEIKATVKSKIALHIIGVKNNISKEDDK